MNMADLITKVVKASNPAGYPDYSNSRSRSNPKSSQRAPTTGSKKIASMFGGGNTTFVEAGGDDIELPARSGAGIQKTTTTQVVIKPANQSGDYDDHDFASESSSTRQLKREHYAV